MGSLATFSAAAHDAGRTVDPVVTGAESGAEEPADDLIISSALVSVGDATTPVRRPLGPASAPVQGTGLRRIGPYEIVAEIARGGMGVVYLCRRAGDAGFERLLAVKHLHAHLAADREFVAMLLDEARITARIHHHNVASVFELGRFEHGYYLVMPYIEGCSLAQLLVRSKTFRPPALLVAIMIDALLGLHAAHTVDGDVGPGSLVHRDVSPSNILVGCDGAARVTDFGVAKARARISSTRKGTIKGTLCYVAPEVLRSEEVDHRADVFAAGAVLWTALTGRRLFQGASDAETIARVLSLEVPPPSQVGLGSPAVFDSIVLKALARDPDQRYATAADMALALREVALDAGMLGAPTEVARWVLDTFAGELDERHRRISDAATRGDPASVVVLPPLAVTTSAQAAPPEPATVADVVRFVAAVVLAFIAGSLVTLYVRGAL